VSAAGPIDEVITAERLTEAFGIPLQVSREGDRFAARGA